jgi:uncharacterized protein (TIRG00374 family)
MLKPRIPLLLKIIVSAVLLSVLIFKTQGSGILASLRDTNLSMFLIALFFSSLTILIRSYKWQLLLRVQGTQISLFMLQSLNYMALFFNNFFLGSLGGDAFKIYRMTASPYSKAGVLSSMVMERLTGISMFFLVVLLAYIVSYFSDIPIAPDIFLIPILLINLLIVSFSFILIKFSPKISILGHNLPVLGKVLGTIVLNIDVHKKHRNTFLLCLFLSILFYLLNIVAMYYYVLSANEDVHFIHLALIVPIALFIAMIPISMNGLGVQESAFFYYFSQLGVNSSSAFIIALLPRIGMYLFSLVGALLYFIELLKGAGSKY